MALRKWPSDPAATTAYLQGALGLTFDHPAPVGASRAVTDKQGQRFVPLLQDGQIRWHQKTPDVACSHAMCARLQALAAEEAAAADAAAGEQPGAASRRKLSSALDPSLYSDRAVLELVGGTLEVLQRAPCYLATWRTLGGHMRSGSATGCTQAAPNAPALSLPRLPRFLDATCFHSGSHCTYGPCPSPRAVSAPPGRAAGSQCHQGLPARPAQAASTAVRAHGLRRRRGPTRCTGRTAWGPPPGGGWDGQRPAAGLAALARGRRGAAGEDGRAGAKDRGDHPGGQTWVRVGVRGRPKVRWAWCTGGRDVLCRRGTVSQQQGRPGVVAQGAEVTRVALFLLLGGASSL